MKKEEFKPYIPADKVMPEMTVTAVILGCILAVVFGGANAYLGLRVGMTISASIPAAVVSMGIIRMILRRESILENNMVQTIGSAGEALAGGAIFTLPVLYMWANEGSIEMPSLLEIGVICLCGGILGVAFMIPLRQSLIVEEHGILPYPEGTACSEVLIAGEEGGTKASTVFKGMGIAAVYKFIADGLGVFPSEISYTLPYKGALIGADILPALTGVGYICGPRAASFMFGGGLLSWFVLMPMIVTFGSDLVLYPATISVSEVYSSMGPSGLWSYYIRYIGAGAVLGGGIIEMVKVIPTLVKVLVSSVKNLSGRSDDNSRTAQNIPGKAIVGLLVACVLVMWFAPFIPLNFLGAVIVVVFGFMFATVTSRIVGMVGCNNNPASSMTIATLVITCLLFKLVGYTGITAMSSALVIGCVVCTVSCVSGDTSQDLKTGFLVGATPKYQQLGEIIGIAVASVSIGGILLLLNTAWGFGGAELSAPQATLMRMVIEGIMGGNLPWTLILIGVCIAVIITMLQIPVLLFCVGMYLPIYTTATVMIGGVVRLIVDKIKYAFEEQHKSVVDSGVLYTSGMIAGEGVLGILLAVLAIVPTADGTLANTLNISGILNIGQGGGIIVYLLLILTIFKMTFWNKKLK
ncbi:MAG: oligopeptide transporter, OPT family [Clostridiales bacterium]|nr:oligopeptide transporter, OPT family [Clostridiales bacterium]